jgi:filamentous hemagglutinin family protein
MTIRSPRLLPLVLACTAALALLPVAHANPTGGTVASGTATIASSGNTLTVTNSPNAIINWQGFSIGAGELTRFVQQNAASTVLNRVTGASGSTIHGQLESNGRVFLVNPNGVLFGPGAQLSVAGLVASTLDITNGDFLAGNYQFTAGMSNAAGRVDTALATGDGFFALIAPQIAVSGSIRSRAGDILLLAGTRVTLPFTNGAPGTASVDGAAGTGIDFSPGGWPSSFSSEGGLVVANIGGMSISIPRGGFPPVPLIPPPPGGAGPVTTPVPVDIPVPLPQPVSNPVPVAVPAPVEKQLPPVIPVSPAAPPTAAASTAVPAPVQAGPVVTAAPAASSLASAALQQQGAVQAQGNAFALNLAKREAQF